MGKETTLQAFPEDWNVLMQVRSGDLTGEDIGTVVCFLSWLRRKRCSTKADAYFEKDDDPKNLLIYRETLSLVKSHPALLWMTGDIDRRFDVLRYLMLESSTSVSRQQLYRYSLGGCEQIHPTAHASQGHPIMWNDVDTTRAIYRGIADLDFGTIADHYGTTKFDQSSLYKKQTDRRELSNLYTYFCQLKEYYRAAAIAGFATLVYID